MRQCMQDVSRWEEYLEFTIFDILKVKQLHIINCNRLQINENYISKNVWAAQCTMEYIE